MFTLIVVEDEDIVREGLITTIPWEQYGFRAVGSAANGKEGLELYKSLKPDVIMTDIKMPVLDGLELLKAAKAMDPEVQVVLLSGHEEFEFAKRGVEFGAFAYVLKLDLFEELDEVFVRLQLKLEEALKNKKKIKELVDIKISQEILKTLKGKVTSDIPLKGEYNAVAVVWHPVKANREKVVRELNNCFLIAARNEEYIVLLCASNSEPRAFDASLTVQIENLKNIFEESFTGGYLVGIGSSRARAEVAVSYKEAMKMVDYGRAARPKGIYSYPYEKGRLKKGDIPLDMPTLIKFAGLNKKDEVKRLLEECFTRMLETEGYFYSDLRVVFYDVLMCLCKTVKGLETAQAASDNIDYLIGQLNTIDSMRDMKDWFFHAYDTISGRIEAYRKSEYYENFQKVISFIEGNYSSNIRMQEMAELIYMSPPYFSSRFKEIMGLNFIDYLRKKRIDKSAELLVSTNKKIGDIAEEVGYEDEKYFFRIFKNEMQMSPQQYRETMRQPV